MAHTVLNGLEVELNIRNDSSKTTHSYTHVAQKALHNIRSPLDDVLADGKKSWVTSGGKDRTPFIKSASVDKHHTFVYPQIDLRERRRDEG